MSKRRPFTRSKRSSPRLRSKSKQQLNPFESGLPKQRAKPSRDESGGRNEDLDAFKSEQEIHAKKETYEVEKIIGQRVNKAGIQFYLIKWKGYSTEEATYEPISCLENVKDMVEQFRRQHMGR